MTRQTLYFGNTSAVREKLNHKPKGANNTFAHPLRTPFVHLQLFNLATLHGFLQVYMFSAGVIFCYGGSCYSVSLNLEYNSGHQLVSEFVLDR